MEFFVDGAGQRMRWAAVPYSLIAAEYMRLLSHGACIGAGVIKEFPEINRFSADAMGLQLLVGSWDVRVEEVSRMRQHQTVAASAWVGMGNLLLAAYNSETTGTTSAKITIAAKAMDAAGVRAIGSSHGHIINPAGHSIPDKGLQAALEADGALKVVANLAPREGLLYWIGA
jgi:hypothetical protein